jgi:hypothetical protein
MVVQARLNKMHELLGVIGRISEYTRVEPPIQAIATSNHNAMFVGVHEIVIQQDLPLGMD